MFLIIFNYFIKNREKIIIHHKNNLPLLVIFIKNNFYYLFSVIFVKYFNIF